MQFKLTRELMNRFRLLTAVLFIGIFTSVFSQNPQADSLKTVIQTLPDNKDKVNALINLSGNLVRTDANLALKYANNARILAEKIDFKSGEGYALKAIGMAYYFQSDYVEALISWQQALAVFQEIDDKVGISNMLNNLGAVSFNKGDDEKALQYYLESLNAAEQSGDTLRITTALLNIGAVYFNKESTHDLALEYYLKALPLSEQGGDQEAIGTAEVNIGEIYLARGDDNSALTYFQKGLEAYKKTENGNVPYALYNIGKVYTQRGDYETAIRYQNEAFNLAKSLNSKKEMSQAMIGLAEAYAKKGENSKAISAYHNAQEIAHEIGANYQLKDAYQGLAELYSKLSDFRRAYQYQNLYSGIKDTLYNSEMDKRMQSMVLKSELEKKQGEIDLLEKDKLQKIQQSKNQRLWIFSISGALMSALLLSFVLYRNNKNKQKSNALLKKQKEEIQKTLEKLKDTQSQLIHAEKMASLGELTAGIAHEIQNPLNFVNNFSEVSSEMIEEMIEELGKGDLDEVKLIANDIKQNLQKINIHGKRADSIVRGMLQHSRSNSGTKEPTAINEMANEYLRLAYHGLRAKDDSFNVSFKTDFDENIGKINIVPQEISRVLLNILTNAFYAVKEKNRHHPEGYKPEVSLSTRMKGNKVEIKIEDNANGIPDHVLGKIFQPFFTTKPTGEGTGLGLSLSYDIITKGHGGELNVDTKVGEGTVFTIILPV